MARVIALLSAHNEEDILGQALDHLIGQGIEVYVIDDGSTDATGQVAEARLGRGVIAIERRDRAAAAKSFAWEAILRRKEELASELQADWFIHHDADEFRESPWEHLTMREALDLVARLGYNAVDFLALNFPPIDDSFRPETPVTEAFPFCEPVQSYDRVQIKCWRGGQGAVDLVALGGHDARFANRRVFPIRFLLRHYPIRTQDQGTRKVFAERLPRLNPSEREQGWHRQYDNCRPGDTFIRRREDLIRYDAAAVRRSLSDDARADGVIQALEQALADAREQLRAAAATAADGQRHRLGIEAQIREIEREAARLRSEVDALRASASWKVTAPLRATYRTFLGERSPGDVSDPPFDGGLAPVSRTWGTERGKPIDRYYIEGFLRRHGGDIRGRVLEIKDSGYTRAFGGDAVTDAQILDVDRSNPRATIVADLAGPPIDVTPLFDCVILTQTLHIIYDIRAAVRQTLRLLAPGGVLLCTIPAVSRVNDESGGLESGDYWRLTAAAVRKLFGDAAPGHSLEIETYGNVRACSAFLYGLAADELTMTELDFVDPWFPLVHCVRLRRG